jgi:superoxide dismutase, Fe-Mn family
MLTVTRLDTPQSKHRLPELAYDVAALEPHIDARTMALHHGKHHASYVEKLNATLEPFPDLHEQTALWLLINLGKLPREIRAAVRSNAGGHLNHSLFWQAMSPTGGGAPSGLLAEAIRQDFGSFDLFKARFERAGAALFGSGWVWLVRAQKPGAGLEVITTCGHDNPATQGRFPLLVNDVWEHGYYLKHENRRAEYLQGWWSVADWREAARRYERSDLSPAIPLDADAAAVSERHLTKRFPWARKTF